MELGNKIKKLRYKAGYTQEQLAERMQVSPQAVSKWENEVAMPDITLLPALAEVFGVSIDELFDLTADEKLRRIENRMDTENELAGELFYEYEEYLKTQLNESKDRRRILSLLARLYYHRMESDGRKVGRYAREAICLAPGVKDCQWLLIKAEGHVGWDWNITNHSRAIDFYKAIIAEEKGEPRSHLPYLYLLDNLIADRRTEEARAYLAEVQKLPTFRRFLKPVYEMHIALAEFDRQKAESVLKEALKEYADDSGFLFETAQYCASICEYEKAVGYYEASYRKEERKPRYTDALEAVAMVYEIMGEYKKAADTRDRIIGALKSEWGYREGDSAVEEQEEEKRRLLEKLG